MVSAREPNAYWISAISCTDVDATVSAVEAAGGEAVRGPVDLPNRGRVAMVRDPEGALVQLVSSSTGDPTAVVAKVSAAGGRVAVPPKPSYRDGAVALLLDPSGAPIAIQKWSGPREDVAPSDPAA